MLKKIKEKFSKRPAIKWPAIFAVIGTFGFITAPLTLGLVALTPLLPVLTGSALAIIAFRQFGSQSEVLKGDNPNTAIGVGYTQVLMCSLVFTTLGFVSPFLGPVAPFIIPVWYGSIAYTVLAALCGGGYNKIRSDWSVSPFRLMRDFVKGIDTLISYIPFRTQLGYYIGKSHKWLGTIYFVAQVALFSSLLFLGPSLFAIGASGVAVLGISYVRAMNVLNTRLSTVIERTSVWVGICAGLFISNPVLQVYTIYTLTSILVLEAGSYIGSKRFDVKNTGLKNSADKNEQEISSDDLSKKLAWDRVEKESLECLEKQIPSFKSMDELICDTTRHGFYEKVTDLSIEEMLILKTNELKQEYRKRAIQTEILETTEAEFVEKHLVKYKELFQYNERERLQQEYDREFQTQKLEAFKQAQQQFSQLGASSKIADRISYALQYVPRQAYWYFTRIEAPKTSLEEYISKRLSKVKDATETYKQAILETEMMHLKNAFHQFHKEDYDAAVAKHAEFLAKKHSQSVVSRATYYIGYVPITVFWYISRFFRAARLPNTFINNKLNEKELTVNNDHIANMPKFPPLTGNIAAFDYLQAKETILSIFAADEFTPVIDETQTDDASFKAAAEEISKTNEVLHLLVKCVENVDDFVQAAIRIANCKNQVLMGREFTAYLNSSLKLSQEQRLELQQHSTDIVKFFNSQSCKEFAQNAGAGADLKAGINIAFRNYCINKINQFVGDLNTGLHSVIPDQEDITEIDNTNDDLAQKITDFMNRLAPVQATFDAAIDARKLEQERKYKERQGQARDKFAADLEAFLLKMKTGKGLGMDKAASNVETMQKIGKEVVDFLVAEIAKGDVSKPVTQIIDGEETTINEYSMTEGIGLAKTLIRNLIEDTTGRCAQAPFTDLSGMYNTYILGPKIQKGVDDALYKAKDLLAFHMQRLRLRKILGLKEYFERDPMIRSLAFNLDFRDHHVFSSFITSLKSLNLEPFSALHDDLSTDSIDLLKEVTTGTMAYATKRVAMLADTL